MNGMMTEVAERTRAYVKPAKREEGIDSPLSDILFGMHAACLDHRDTVAGDSDELFCDVEITQLDFAQPEIRILIADDCEQIRKTLILFLQDTGVRVVEVGNGKEAVEAVAASLQSGQPFDVILMDVQMPVMDGLAATRALRERGWTRPIIAVSGNSEPADRIRSAEAGCTFHVAKPVRNGELREVLYAHLPSFEQLGNAQGRASTD